MKKRESVEKRHVLRSDDGTRIAVTHYDSGSESLLLLAPGFWRRRADREIVFLAAHFSRAGYDVATLDFRGHGDSAGKYTFGREEWRDFVAVARSLAGAHRSIAALGFSMGGAIAAEAILRAPDLPFRALVMISAPADFARLRPRPWKPAAWKMMGVGRALAPPRVDWTTFPREKPRAEDAVEKLTLPKLIVTFENDWLVNPSHGDRLFRSAAAPVERVHLDVGNSLHADAVVRFAPVSFLRVLTEFLNRRFPASCERGSAVSRR
ncbi:MAG: alpha/beta hydrolase [Thermoanaerobaculia bacterium]